MGKGAEKRIEEIEKRVKMIEDRLNSHDEMSSPGPKVIEEAGRIKLIEGYDMFGSYAVIDQSGEIYLYKEYKRAKEIFERLSGRTSPF